MGGIVTCWGWEEKARAHPERRFDVSSLASTACDSRSSIQSVRHPALTRVYKNAVRFGESSLGKKSENPTVLSRRPRWPHDLAALTAGLPLGNRVRDSSDMPPD